MGTASGDEVLNRVGQILNQTAQRKRPRLPIWRRGIRDPDALHEAWTKPPKAAERLRLELESAAFPNLSITASLGVSALSLGATDPQDLLDQADRCLYAAKRMGRNQVVRWDQFPEDYEMEETTDLRL